MTAVMQQALIGSYGGGEDPYWNNVALLIHGDSLTDSSSYGHSLTANSYITTKTSPTPPFGTKSIEIGNNNWAEFNTTGNLSSPAIGTGDFTIEYHVRQDSLDNWHTHFGSRYGTGSYLNQSQSTFNIGVNRNGSLFVHRAQSNSVMFTSGFTRNNWHYVALVRDGGTWALWLNGVRKVTNSQFSNQNYTANSWGIGTGAVNPAARERLRGHIMNLRFTVGVARYSHLQTSIPVPTDLFPTN